MYTPLICCNLIFVGCCHFKGSGFAFRTTPSSQWLLYKGFCLSTSLPNDFVMFLLFLSKLVANFDDGYCFKGT